MASEKINLAIIGVGKIARDQHAPALARSRAFKLSATVSPDGGFDGTPNFASLEAMIAADMQPDAVAICTPPQVRGALARDALALGLDVLLEKPPAASLAELADLKRRAARTGAVLFAAWHSRHASMVGAARDWLASRVVTGGDVIWREDVRRWHPGQTWLWAPGGPGVFDPGINALSILTEILPEPLAVRAARFATPANAHAPIAASLDLASGAAAIAAHFDFREQGEQRWEILLDTACGHRLRLLEGGARLAIDDETPITAADQEYDGVYSRFAQLITTRTSDADARPLRLLADAFGLAQTEPVEAFAE